MGNCNLIDQFPLPLWLCPILVQAQMLAILLDRTTAIAAIPQMVMALAAIRCFIIDKKHLILFAGDLRTHF